MKDPRFLASMQTQRDQLEQKNDSIRRWLLALRTLTGSQLTVDRGLNVMIHFSTWTGKDPDALITERVHDLKEDDIRLRSRHEELLMKYFQTFKSRGTGVGAMSYVKSFYRHNYVPLQCKIPRAWRVTSEKVPTQGEIRRMMSVSNLRDRAVIAFLAQSGVRLGTLCQLTYGDISQDLEAGKTPVHIKVMPFQAKGKRAEGYDTFIGPEAVDALKAYLDSRRRGTRHIEGESIKADAPLFRRQLNGDKESVPIGDDSIEQLVTQAAIRAGVIEAKKKPGDWSQVRPHCLRKFYQTSLERAGIPHNWVKRLLGHQLPASEDPYSKPTVEDLRKAYERALPHLALSDATIELTAQKETIEELRARLEKIEAVQERDYVLAANPRGRPSTGATRRKR
jgi:integrase